MIHKQIHETNPRTAYGRSASFGNLMKALSLFCLLLAGCTGGIGNVSLTGDSPSVITPKRESRITSRKVPSQ